MHKWSVRLLVLAASVGLAACGERLEGGAACPILCSGQSLTLRDTMVDGVVLDTTLSGFPPRGAADFLMIANSGDTAEVRYVVRYDSLITTYVKAGDTIPITSVDSAHLRISIAVAQSRFSGPVTFEAYDVDAMTPDSMTSALLPLFSAERLLGTVTVDSADLKDSVRIFLDNGRVAQHLVNGQRLRIGVRIRSAAPARVAVYSANTGSFPRLGYDPAPADTAIDGLTVVPASFTPESDRRIAVDFTDYIIPVGGSALPPDAVGVGGPRGRRVYLRFSIPARITDSTTVVRATLILTQRPAPTYGFSDSIVVGAQVVVATSEITDLAKAALITDTVPGRNPPSAFGLSSIRIPPCGAVEREFDIVNVVRFWRSTTAERVPQAIVLRSANEATSILEAHFYSTEAAAALRPRLLLTYVPRSEFGIP